MFPSKNSAGKSTVFLLNPVVSLSQSNAKTRVNCIENIKGRAVSDIGSGYQTAIADETGRVRKCLAHSVSDLLFHSSMFVIAEHSTVQPDLTINLFMWEPTVETPICRLVSGIEIETHKCFLFNLTSNCQFFLFLFVVLCSYSNL